MNENELPKGWKWAKLGDITNVGQGGTPSTDKAEYWHGKIHWLRSGEINFNRINRSETTITEEGLENSAAKLLPKGTVILAMTGQGLTRGRAAILDIEAAANQSVAHMIVDSSIILTEYLFYYFKMEYWNIRQIYKGSNQPGLNTTLIKQFNIPLPPLSEQYRIVSKINELLLETKAAKESIDKIHPVLKKLRESILVAAFRGKLTERDPNDEPAGKLLRIRSERKKRLEEDLRAKGKDSKKFAYEQSTEFGFNEPYELPNGWIWIRLKEISEKIQYGTSEKTTNAPYGIPVMRMGNIQNGKIIFEDLKYLKQ